MKKEEVIVEYCKANPDDCYQDVALSLDVSQSYTFAIMTKNGLIKKKPKKEPKILLFDLETAPMEGYFWSCKQDYIDPQFIKKPISILSWSAKWLYDSEIMSEVVTPRNAFNRIDKTILKNLWKLLDEAQIIIAHNLKGFDDKVANGRFILNDMNKPSDYKLIDTLSASRGAFKFASNRLDYIAQILVGNKKRETNWGLWKRCIENGKEAEEALEDMRKYNIQDVRILEEVYLKMRPWIKGHPNVGIFYDDIKNRCPRCGSKNIKLKGKYYTGLARYKAVVCQDCKYQGRTKYQELSVKERKELVSPIPK